MNELLTFQFDQEKLSELAELELACGSISVGGWIVEKAKQQAEADANALIAWIKAIREKLGLSQIELATLLQVSATILNDWETGQQSLSGPAIRLYQLFEADPDGTRTRIGQLAESQLRF